MQWDRITAISSVIIALLALIASVYQASLNRKLTLQEGEEAREHRRLSVKPSLLYMRDLSDRSPKPGFLLQNRGLGPAELRDLTVFRGRELIARWSSTEEGLRALDELGINRETVDFFTVHGAFILREGEDLPLLTTTPEAFLEPEWNDHFSSVITSLDVGFCYCSLYGECWKATTWGPTYPEPGGCWNVSYGDG